jgi:hypothetical protein
MLWVLCPLVMWVVQMLWSHDQLISGEVVSYRAGWTSCPLLPAMLWGQRQLHIMQAPLRRH